MLVPNIYIEFLSRDFAIRKINGFRVESSWKLLTDRATIKLPRNVRDFDKQRIKELFRRGDKVRISGGYNGRFNTLFNGYITKVSADTPIEITCEDEMWKLKQIAVHKSFKKVSLKQLLNSIATGYTIDALDVADLGNQRFVNTTVAKILEYLKDEYSLHSYFKIDGTLVVGKIYADDSEVVKFGLEKNVADASQLKYRQADDISIKVKAVSTLSDGSKVEAETGDTGGEVRQLSYYGISDQTELKRLAELDYQKYKVDGFEGSFKTWGEPVIRHGEKAEFESFRFPERNGQYYSDAVTTTFDTNGLKQTIEIGAKV